MNKNVSPAPTPAWCAGQKGFAHLFLLFVIVISAVGGLIYYSWQKGLIKTTPTQETSLTPTVSINETTDWKTYVFSNMGFKIDIPENWTIDPPTITDSSPFNCKGIPECSSFSFMILPNSKIPSTIPKSIGKQGLYGGSTGVIRCWTGGFSLSKDNNIESSRIIDGLKVRTLTTPPEKQNEIYRTQVEIPLNKIQEDLICYYDERITVDKFDQILSTFKFIDKSNTKMNSFPTNSYNIDVGLSFTGLHGESDKYYFHVSSKDEKGFIPTSITIVNSDTNNVGAGPFRLTKKISNLCGDKVLYETEGINSTIFPNEFLNFPDNYFYRVTGINNSQSEVSFVFDDSPFVCQSSSE